MNGGNNQCSDDKMTAHWVIISTILYSCQMENRDCADLSSSKLIAKANIAKKPGIVRPILDLVAKRRWDIGEL